MRIATALFAAAALCACSQPAPSSEAPADSGAASAPAAFPNLFQTAYRLEGEIIEPASGKRTPLVMVRDGQKMRIEVATERGPMVVISDRASGDYTMIMGEGSTRMAMRQQGGGAVELPDEYWSGDMSGKATLVGPCAAAGETGNEWQSTDDDGKVQRGCLTGDGVILAASSDGEQTWEVKSLTRGPQGADNFTVPDGVRVMNLGAGAADAIAKMKAQMGN